ncbi:hypothetical protein ACFLSJ_04485 [Verrucomicrobiota bacterium]
MISDHDRDILRDLARRVAELAADSVQDEKLELWRKLNALDPVRPMVMLHNATWHETGYQIQLKCESDWARSQEWGLRERIYQAEHMNDDSVVLPEIDAPLVIHIPGYGIETNTTDPDHVFGARKYNTVLDDDADPAMIPDPQVCFDEAATAEQYQRLCDLYGDILSVVKKGRTGFWFSIMDQFIQWRGLEKTFVDMVDRPKWVHGWMARMTEVNLAILDELEEINGLSLNNVARMCGSGGMGATDLLPADDFDGTHVRSKDMWGHATTQIFSEVSPAMHEDFALRYEKRWLDRFGLSNYGCCEPLDRKVDIIRKYIGNLRRLSMSPWVDITRGAEAIGKDFIFSWKPNPAILGSERWNPEYIREYTRDALERTRGCAVEIIMKDLHTVRGEPQRMWEWCSIAKEEVERIAAA